jgi:hypothetical protein
MMRYFVLVFVLLLFSCCNVNYYTTPEGGYRLVNSKKFEYNKPQYASKDKSAIDTTCIYVLDSTYNKWDDVKIKKESYRFLRFFSKGQVLFIYNKGLPNLDMINNKNIGNSGYYYIEDNKLKINVFKMVNGGVIVDYFGEITPNGNIVFYEQVSEDLKFSKAKEYDRKSFWSKVKIEKIEHYKPDW